MLVIENDWIEYEATERATTVARRQAVRGGAACATRFPAASVRTAPVLRAVPRPVPVAVPAGARRRLRLTRRGRLVLVVLPALALLSGALVTSTARVAEAAPAPLPAVRVVVGSGDSLWTVAERVAPQQDPRDVVAALEQANGLHGAEVEAGQRLVVPQAVLAR